MQERLQKIIARAGIASRRHAEELIRSGMVTVNGRTVTELGSKADESTDHIKVSGKLLRPEHDRIYLALNKPTEVVSTMSDPEGRRSLQDLLHGVALRVFPVGRLEYHSMGLVFLTNDGELANRMLKAHRLRQTYLMKLKSLLTFDEIEQLARSTGARITRVRGKESPWYEVTLTEARRDSLRNRLFQTGHPVEKMKRIRLGNLELGSLQPGGHRTLSSEEVASLSRAIEGKLEPASESSPIKRTHVRRSATEADPHRSAGRSRRRNSERQPVPGHERRSGFKATKQSRIRPRKAR
jgi:23S rRNA pseudouridine2605 synthase